MSDKKIEDLTHEDYMVIAKYIPLKMSFKELRSLSKTVADMFSLPYEDSVAGILIASSIKTGSTVYEYESKKESRIKEVIEERNKKAPLAN